MLTGHNWLSNSVLFAIYPIPIHCQLYVLIANLFVWQAHLNAIFCTKASTILFSKYCQFINQICILIKSVVIVARKNIHSYINTRGYTLIQILAGTAGAAVRCISDCDESLKSQTSFQKVWKSVGIQLVERSEIKWILFTFRWWWPKLYLSEYLFLVLCSIVYWNRCRNLRNIFVLKYIFTHIYFQSLLQVADRPINAWLKSCQVKRR